MTAKTPRRTFVLTVIIAACLLGVASRIVMATEHRIAHVIAVETELRVGQPLGDAVYDGVYDDGPSNFRLLWKGCDDPIVAVPMPLYFVGAPDVADRAFGRLAGYISTDVYRGKIRTNFSYFDRLIARNPFQAAGFFVRFYASSACAVDTDAYGKLASAVLNVVPGSSGEDWPSLNP